MLYCAELYTTLNNAQKCIFNVLLKLSDSIYTERYMNQPYDNAASYQVSLSD